ncbi:MAG: hypothetical protein V1717_02180 [Candidatus Micrarchaeota archaeon]
MPRKMRMEEKENCKCGYCGGRGKGVGMLLFGIFLLLIGLSWLGNDMGWWNFSLPWVPLSVSLVAICLIVKWFWKRQCC